MSSTSEIDPAEVRPRVKEINVLCRTARMNTRYYAKRLHAVTRETRVVDIVIAIGSSGSMGAWALWKYGQIGPNAWAIIAGVATLLAVIKPILQREREIERYSKLHQEYCGLYYDLDHLTTELRTKESLTTSIWDEFLRLRKKARELGPMDDTDAQRDEKLLGQCRNDVLRELPKGTFWLPTRKSLPRTGDPHGND